MRDRKRRHFLFGGCGCILVMLLFPAFGMGFLFGAAAFLDSERHVLNRARSPDGAWVAQLERLVVGGAPNMVITLRRSWQPDWYFTSCKAISHYGDAGAVLRWAGAAELVVDADASAQTWRNDPPFRWDGPLSSAPGCRPIVVTVR